MRTKAAHQWREFDNLTGLNETMGSALPSLTEPQSLPSLEPRLSPCEIQLDSVAAGSRAHLYLHDALARSLSKEPHPGTTLLTEVRYAGSSTLVRFEQGDGSLEQMLCSAARGSALLPLPFLWSVRVVSEAAAALDFHHRLGISSALALAPHGIITLHGETRLNAAILEPRSKLAGVEEPHRLSLASTLSACLSGADRSRRLAWKRPLLPASVIQFVDAGPARAREDASWQSEHERLSQQRRRLQGLHFSVSSPSRRSERELRVQQLGLLPALLRLAGAPAIDRFFAQVCGETHAPNEELCAARAAWVAERRLVPPPAAPGSATLESAKIARDVASQARVGQARFEFERKDPRVALLFAIDAAQASPESPDAWLTLGEIRGSSCAGSQALCLSEAICASRGDKRVLGLVLEQLGLRHERELATYFRVYGDHVLADWLEPRPQPQPTSLLRH
jgi:hypothetical protein